MVKTSLTAGGMDAMNAEVPSKLEYEVENQVIRALPKALDSDVDMHQHTHSGRSLCTL